VTAEPVEVLIVIFAFFALVTSLRLCGQAWDTARLADQVGRCEAVRRLGWGRVRNELVRAIISACVLYGGLVQATASPPVVESPYRWILQWIWVIVGVLCLGSSISNEVTTRRVIEIIERERSAGRMR